MKSSAIKNFVKNDFKPTLKINKNKQNSSTNISNEKGSSKNTKNYSFDISIQNKAKNHTPENACVKPHLKSDKSDKSDKRILKENTNVEINIDSNKKAQEDLEKKIISEIQNNKNKFNLIMTSLTNKENLISKNLTTKSKNDSLLIDLSSNSPRYRNFKKGNLTECSSKSSSKKKINNISINKSNVKIKYFS